MVTLQKLTTFFEKLAPKELAEDYDNVGLLVEGVTDEIESIVIALDADEKTVLEAAEKGAQLVVTHHPVMFRSVNRLTEGEGGQRTLRRLLQKGIGLYAMHTNYDSAQGGLCDVFLDAFGEFSERSSFAGTEAGIGRIGILKTPCTLADLLKKGKQAFCPNGFLRYVGNENAMIDTVAVCNGGGADMIYEAYALGAQVYISGDCKHHHARFAYENNMNLIEINHYDAEVGFCRQIAEQLQQAFGNKLKVEVSCHEESPWKCI